MVRELFDVVWRAFLLGCLSLFVLVAGSACSLVTAQGPTVQLDPDVDDRLGGTGVESGDIRGASEQIALEIIKMRHESAPTIAVAPVKNLSRFRVDPALLKNRLTHDLARKARGRFVLIPIDSENPSATVDLVLFTEVRSLTKDNGATTSDYIQYAFTLERPSDGALVWTGMFETKRKSDVDVIYQ